MNDREKKDHLINVIRGLAQLETYFAELGEIEVRDKLRKYSMGLMDIYDSIQVHDVAVLSPTTQGFLITGRKIDAIRNHRQETGCTLKDAKDAVESWALLNPQVFINTQP